MEGMELLLFFFIAIFFFFTISRPTTMKRDRCFVRENVLYFSSLWTITVMEEKQTQQQAL